MNATALKINSTEPKSKKKSKPSNTKSRTKLKYAKKLAMLTGGVGVGVLSLSVAHCTESITMLTGSHWTLSALLAVGIDAGMVVSELSELASYGTKSEAEIKPWTRGYTVAAVLLSVLLNAYAFGQHAAPGMVWAAWLLGAVVPGLIYALGRVAGGLFRESL